MDKDVQKIIIFGAGIIGKKTADLLSKIDTYDICAILDNYNYDYTYNELLVRNAKEYLIEDVGDDSIYVVEGKYIEDYYLQLQAAGIPRERIKSLPALLASSQKEKKTECSYTQAKNLYIFDYSVGFVMGGVERWSSLVSDEIMKNEKNECLVYTENLELDAPTQYQNKVIYFDAEGYPRIEKAVAYFEEIIHEYKNIIFVCDYINTFSAIAAIIKKRYPEHVKTLSVIHSSLPINATENLLTEDCFDSIVCVNAWLCNELKTRAKNPNKIQYYPNPTAIYERSKRQIRKGALRIGYAARLVKRCKRADYLLDFIEYMESKNIDYILNIAGDGECKSEIEKLIVQTNNQHVILHGPIEFEKMPEFWRNQDIAINVSESEGCPMALLEAMEAGCVPIYTHTLGMEKLIEDKYCGYLVDIGDMKTLADRVVYLAENRERLYDIGLNARVWIENNCDINQYVKMIENMLAIE